MEGITEFDCPLIAGCNNLFPKMVSEILRCSYHADVCYVCRFFFSYKVGFNLLFDLIKTPEMLLVMDSGGHTVF